MNRKISIIGSVGLPARYGGWETLVDQLTLKLSTKYDFTVYCSKIKYSEYYSEYNGAKLEYINLDANGIQSIFYDIYSMIHSYRKSNIIFVLGVSGCIFLPLLRFICDCKIIVNIDGLEWKRKKWGPLAKLFLKLSESIAVRYSHVVIADNKSIFEYIKNTYSITSLLIPYGGDQVLMKSKNNDADIDLLKLYDLSIKKYAITVCRIEPENNIELIIDSFNNFSKLKLVIVGNWSNSNYGKNLYNKFKNTKNLLLLDPIYDPFKINKLRENCYIYVHGHSAGGTNPSLVEAMNMHLAILAFDCCFNRETTSSMALFFDSVDSLVDQLSKLTDIDVNDLGIVMGAMAKERYTWGRVSSMYDEIFAN
jgi:glycosyltransferase involved in cell wall biosynthesis